MFHFEQVSGTWNEANSNAAVIWVFNKDIHIPL